jgi:hypothetical protein
VSGASLKTILPLYFAALVLVACSESTDGPDRGQTDAASVESAAEAAKARTMPEEGILAAGKYSTAKEFEPSFSFELIGVALRLHYLTQALPPLY